MPCQNHAMLIALILCYWHAIYNRLILSIFQMFSVADRLLFADRSISTFLKSWIVFYSVGLNNEHYRNYLRTIEGLKPWDRSYAVYDPVWKYYPDCCFDVNEGLSVAEASFEWQCFIDKWASVTLYTNPYEVVNTNNGMGLGLRTKFRIRLSSLSDVLDGFLEFVSEVLFQVLTTLRYRSLYTFVDATGNRLYCVLFGPLSLANASSISPVGFSNTQDDGFELKFKLYFVFGFNFSF